MFLKYSLILILFHVAACLLPPNYYSSEKPGECPHPNIGVCSMTCRFDLQCPFAMKCCRTGCGGTFCINAVSRKAKTVSGKPGYCPLIPNGPWVCSSRCSVDGDCRGTKKCCKNRCGALACTKSVQSQEDET